MRVMHIALGGCLRPPPVPYGLTEDTGGHIAFVIGAALAQARREDVTNVEIVTRAFDSPQLGNCHVIAEQVVARKCTIRRLRTAQSGYLSKEALDAEIPALAEALVSFLHGAVERPDVIHAHFADAAELARAAKLAFGIPYIYSSHSLGLDKLRRGPLTGQPGITKRIAREAVAIREADAIIASSRDEAERQIAAYDLTAEGKVHRVNPGVTIQLGADKAPARSLIAPFLRNPDKPIILAIARPIRKKNLSSLVEAYAAAPDVQEQANLVILAGLRDGMGDASQMIVRELFDAVDRHDLWGKVALPRQHGPGHVAGLYAIAAEGGIFVNPAYHEPFGLTLIEAAQAGVPLVATNSGGPVDILRNLGAGELVDPSDMDDIARGIRAALNDPDRRVKAGRAKRRASTIYNWELWADRVQHICSGLNEAARRGARASTLFASDLDGTLTGSRSAAARFAEWRERRDPGIIFAIATGRSVVEARRVLMDWGLPMPDLFISSVGTEIWRWTQTGALTLCEDYAALIGRGWVRERIAEVVAGLGIAPQPIYDRRRWKLSYFGTAEEATQIADNLNALGLAARVVHSHGLLIDVLPRSAGKAAAVSFEAARRGLTITDCVVAGDSGNDLDMLQACPRAIVPSHAHAETRAATTAYRSFAPHADGVLDGLAKFGLITNLPQVAVE